MELIVQTFTQPTHAAVYTGTLLHRAESRAKVIDASGLTVPVVCLELELDNALRTHMHVEQPFPMGAHEQAKAAAHALHKGMRIQVQAPLVDLRLVVCNATSLLPCEPITPDHPKQESLI
jgi:hypothetical protein